MKLKEGVDISGISTEMVLALIIAEGVLASHGEKLVITSGRDGAHMTASKHYKRPMQAVDIRSYMMPNPSERGKELQAALGVQFDVVVEKDHIHLEFDPK